MKFNLTFSTVTIIFGLTNGGFSMNEQNLYADAQAEGQDPKLTGIEMGQVFLRAADKALEAYGDGKITMSEGMDIFSTIYTEAMKEAQD
jgi:hypothetical protein